MSGSGGGGGGGRSPDPADCSTLVLRTHLNSPKPAVLKTLRKGSRLTVELESHGGKAVVVAKTPTGQVAGSITAGSGLAALIACLRKGVEFIAIVNSVAGGGCEVLVQASP
jgi:hypothetical protein